MRLLIELILSKGLIHHLKSHGSWIFVACRRTELYTLMMVITQHVPQGLQGGRISSYLLYVTKIFGPIDSELIVLTLNYDILDDGICLALFNLQVFSLRHWCHTSDAKLFQAGISIGFVFVLQG